MGAALGFNYLYWRIKRCRTTMVLVKQAAWPGKGERPALGNCIDSNWHTHRTRMVCAINSKDRHGSTQTGNLFIKC